MRAPSQRRALGVLFLALSLFFAGIAWAAGAAHEWPILAAAVALALWLASLGFVAMRRSRSPG